MTNTPLNCSSTKSTFFARHTPAFATISALALALQLGFMQPVLADDATTTETDPTAVTTTELPDEETLLKSAQSLFSMSMYNDADGLVIGITGLAPAQIDKIFFDDIDVTELVKDLVAQGIATVTETENSYTLNVPVSPQIEGEYTLAISTADGESLSKKVTLEQYDDSKFTNSIGEITARPYIEGGWFSRDTQITSGTIYATYCSRDYRCFSGFSAGIKDGSFTISCAGHDFCNKPKYVMLSYTSGGIYTTGLINLRNRLGDKIVMYRR